MRLFPNDPAARRHAIQLASAIGALNLLGFALLAVVASQHFELATGAAFGIGLGLTAWSLGARHAFDADHVAAIDNAQRKLIAEGRESLPAGFFFSLGHSTIVLVLGAIVAVGASGLAGELREDDSVLHLVTGTWGPVFAGCFLLLLGALNLFVLRGTVKSARRLRGGEIDEQGFEDELADRTLLGRFYNRATRAVTAPWQMYPVGVLFGFGFDTATEIALLLLAGGAAATGLPFYAVMTLPILFTAGMTLMDTANSAMMRSAYGWALAHPARKIYYNLAATTVTVVCAFAIGFLSLSGALIERLHLEGGVWSAIGNVDLANAGYALVVLFTVMWIGAVLLWRFGSLEQRWDRSR